MFASTSECVRKMTTSSIKFTELPPPILKREHHHCHIIVLIGGTDKRLHVAEDPLAQFFRRQMAMLLDQTA